MYGITSLFINSVLTLSIRVHMNIKIPIVANWYFNIRLCHFRRKAPACFTSGLEYEGRETTSNEVRSFVTESRCKASNLLIRLGTMKKSLKNKRFFLTLILILELLYLNYEHSRNRYSCKNNLELSLYE